MNEASAMAMAVHVLAVAGKNRKMKCVNIVVNWK
jgi:hypothetical protein